MLCFLLLAFSLLFHRADATWLCHGEELQQDSQEGRLEGNTAARWTPPSGAPLPAPGNHGEPWQSPPGRTPSWSVDIRAWQLTFSLPLPQCGMPLTISFLFTYKMLYNFQLDFQLLKVILGSKVLKSSTSGQLHLFWRLVLGGNSTKNIKCWQWKG